MKLEDEATVIILYTEGAPTAALIRETGEIFILMTKSAVNYIGNLSDVYNYDLTYLTPPEETNISRIGIGMNGLRDVLKLMIKYKHKNYRQLDDEIIHLEFLEDTWRQSFIETIKKELAH